MKNYLLITLLALSSMGCNQVAPSAMTTLDGTEWVGKGNQGKITLTFSDKDAVFGASGDAEDQWLVFSGPYHLSKNGKKVFIKPAVMQMVVISGGGISMVGTLKENKLSLGLFGQGTLTFTRSE